ncbi:hypothetical protein [Nonomuraea sp. SYSU D8015]|uniref:hypothetical protein n=1 Tax=Nonomuraea sp. SYSU D8015 TaxID=2593644 RepID=UPI00166039B0|nr:hypothetical protein [Nonomuraea sp. SYSU D8015]
MIRDKLTVRAAYRRVRVDTVLSWVQRLRRPASSCAAAAAAAPNGTSRKHLRVLQRADGHAYMINKEECPCLP